MIMLGDYYEEGVSMYAVDLQGAMAWRIHRFCLAGFSDSHTVAALRDYIIQKQWQGERLPAILVGFRG